MRGCILAIITGGTTRRSIDRGGARAPSAARQSAKPNIFRRYVRRQENFGAHHTALELHANARCNNIRQRSALGGNGITTFVVGETS